VLKVSDQTRHGQTAQQKREKNRKKDGEAEGDEINSTEQANPKSKAEENGEGRMKMHN